METRSVDTFQLMTDCLYHMANQHCIDLSITNMFEEFIIEILAKISKRAHACRFDRYDERYTYIAAALDPDSETLPKLLALNVQFPGLELADITTEAHDRITNIPEEILSRPHIIIRMNSAVIHSEILPHLKKYLDNNERNDFVNEFKRRHINLSYNGTRVRNEFTAMFYRTEMPLFLSNLLDDFIVRLRDRAVIDTLYELTSEFTNEKLEPTKRMHDEADILLLPELVSIINHYLYGVDNHLDANFQTLADTAYREINFFDECPDIDSGYLYLYFYTSFIIEIPTATALTIHNFFNAIGGSRACLLGPREEVERGDKKMECQTLWLRNSVLASPGFLSKMEKHNQRPEKLDQYHKETALAYAKCLNDLSQKDIPSTSPLSTSIARLTAHIKEHPLEKRADTDAYFKAVQDDVKSCVTSSSTMFPRANPIANRVRILLQALTKIMEKKFNPLAEQKMV